MKKYRAKTLCVIALLIAFMPNCISAQIDKSSIETRQIVAEEIPEKSMGLLGSLLSMGIISAPMLVMLCCVIAAANRNS